MENRSTSGAVYVRRLTRNILRHDMKRSGIRKVNKNLWFYWRGKGDSKRSK